MTTLGRISVCLLLFASLISISCGQIPNEEKGDSDWKIVTDAKQDDVRLMPVVFLTGDWGVGSSGGAIMVTRDGGRHWKKAQSPGDSVIQSFEFANKFEGWGSGGTVKISPVILKTSDGGIRWRKLHFENPFNFDISRFPVLLDFCVDASGRGWAIGEGGFLKVEVLEDSWKVVGVVATKTPLVKLACRSSEEAYAVGQDDKVFHYKKALSVRSFGARQSMVNVRITGEGVWLIGADLTQDSPRGWVKESLDDGNTWITRTPTESNTKFFSDIYLEDGIGWLIGTDGDIFLSRDGGESWVQQVSPTSVTLLEIIPLDTRNLWIIGADKVVLKYCCEE